MTQRMTDAAIEKQLRTVGDRLASNRARGERRMDLLRKQAELGDRRDAAIVSARRAASDRPES